MSVFLNVREILEGGVGAKLESSINIKVGNIDGMEVTAPVTGELTLTNLDDRILANFNIHLDANLECTRCLEPYLRKLSHNFATEYLDQEKEDIPVEGIYYIRDFKIDIEEPIKQEILVNLPISGLCRPKCLGLCQECGVNWNNEDCDCEKQDKIDPARNSKKIGDIARRSDFKK